jgi:hypothetical protein
MDDGSFNKSKGYLILCTDSYSKEEVLQLIQVLSDKFKLSVGLVEINKGTRNIYRIRINKSSMDSLRILIKPYFISSMLYKLGLKQL